MTTTIEIEAIVRRVLQRILAGEAAPSSNLLDGNARTATRDSQSESSMPANAIAIHDSLVTLSSLPVNLDGITEVRIGTKSVLTPSARDWFQSKKIRIVRGDNLRKANAPVSVSKSTVASVNEPAVPLILVAGQGSWYAALKRPLCPKATRHTEPAVDDAAALRTISTGLRAGHKAGVIVATSAYNLCWQAARDDKLRPVVVNDWSDLRVILNEVPTNLLILSQSRWNVPSASNAIRAFANHLKSN